MKKTLLFMLACIVASSTAAAAAAGAAASALGQVAAAAEASGCGEPGALACDAESTVVNACTRSGAWRSVRDCAATHEVCVGGRCVSGFGFSMATARAVSCDTPGEKSCSSDCEYVNFCSVANNWVVINKCGAGTICVNGECLSSATNICRTSSTVLCGHASKGVSFPNMEDCSSYLTCDEEWSAPKINYCNSGYYDPCSGNCTLANAQHSNHYEPCSEDNEGHDSAIFGNPSLHYTCAGGSTILKKCESGFYDHNVGQCLGQSVVCRSSC